MNGSNTTQALVIQAQREKERMRAMNGWNTMQALFGITAGIAVARVASEKQGALVYGGAALVGYFLARKFILPV